MPFFVLADEKDFKERFSGKPEKMVPAGRLWPAFFFMHGVWHKAGFKGERTL